MNKRQITKEKATLKPFLTLTPTGQARRLKHLAQCALTAYGLSEAQLSLLGYFENATFRTELPHGQRYLLRVHRPGYNDAPAIGSEMLWLKALKQETPLNVPAPVPTLEGQWWLEVTVDGVPQPRVCTLLEWMEGRMCNTVPAVHHFKQVGKLTAQLHRHARHWQTPPHFTRRSWDVPQLLRLQDQDLWQQLPASSRPLYHQFAQLLQAQLTELGQDPDCYGLLHADLHMGNILFCQGRANPIDFDDCGWGYWLYDLAVILYGCRQKSDYPRWKEALLDSYSQGFPLPEKHLQLIELLMTARSVSVLFWCIERSAEHAFFRQRLPLWKRRTTKRLKQYLAVL